MFYMYDVFLFLVGSSDAPGKRLAENSYPYEWSEYFHICSSTAVLMYVYLLL